MGLLRENLPGEFTEPLLSDLVLPGLLVGKSSVFVSFPFFGEGDREPELHVRLAKSAKEEDRSLADSNPSEASSDGPVSSLSSPLESFESPRRSPLTFGVDFELGSHERGLSLKDFDRLSLSALGSAIGVVLVGAGAFGLSSVVTFTRGALLSKRR